MDPASETLHAILRSIVDAIITIDGEGTITTVNAATESLLGYKPTELIGRNVSILMPEPFRSEHDGYPRSCMTSFASSQRPSWQTRNQGRRFKPRR